jgi:modification methylase
VGPKWAQRWSKNMGKATLSKMGKGVQVSPNDVWVKDPHNMEVVQKVIKLHNENLHAFKMSIDRSIQIGEILWKQKESLGHGKWLPWVAKYLPFSSRSATNYLNLYEHREKLKSESVSDLQTAYKLLANLNNYQRHIQRATTTKRRREFADHRTVFGNHTPGDYLNKILCGDNLKIMTEMVSHGMAGKITNILFSPNYNANFYYGKNVNDNKPYDEYLKDLVSRFPLYAKLLRPGGRAICVIGDVVDNPQKDQIGDYFHPVTADLITSVRSFEPSLRLFSEIIWDKSHRKDPLNNRYGSYCSAECPTPRRVTERIIVWSKDQFNLPNITGQESDLTKEEFLAWSWNSWAITPFVEKGNPSPAAFPPSLAERLIKYFSFPGDIIFDPYCGSATSCRAAHKLGRDWIGIDLNPNYCQYAKNKMKTA